jgi:hypothetical protein
MSREMLYSESLAGETRIIPDVSPRKGSDPVAISYRTIPNAKRSVRASNSLPRTCSGGFQCELSTELPHPLDPAFSSEMFAVFSKVQPFLKDLRERLQKPELLLKIEKVIIGSSKGRARLRRMAKQQAASRKTAMRPVKEKH